ncbi:hypothetical protein BUALT_Bualt07G0109100 [Buddleja alternifolia]|uniref:Ribonuclease n=1 Tax=Buddleja alternifolia TaxID=168488 RepID=A0AAV6XGD3_9LAMI|nr:hypothetical protein BUALT_Bualt07G0109100 [Buddleja alternifolia]
MASTAGSTIWLRGIVKAVPSGDSLVILSITKSEIPLEKTIILSSLEAPKLARRSSVPDEPFAWDSREYLRNLCIGKEVIFKVDYSKPSIKRDFGSVFLENKNVAFLVVAAGWAKVRRQGQQKEDASPFLTELLRLEELAKQQGLGRWTRVAGASEASIRKMPPSTINDPSSFNAMALLEANKGRPLEAFVDQIINGSTIFVYLLPEFQHVKVLVTGIQAPSSGRKGVSQATTISDKASNGKNGESTAEARAQLTSAKRVAPASASRVEVPADPFGKEAKHFTEINVLHRYVRIVLEGVDKYNSLICSVYYPDGESAKDLALELVGNGFAKYVEWSGSLLEAEAKRRLKNAELVAKKDRLRIWTNYIPPATNSKAIHNQSFTGKVIEVVSADCIIVAYDSVPLGDPSAERRVNLSSIRGPKMGNPSRDKKSNPYARDAKEFLRTRLIGKQVLVSMEYSRKVSLPSGASAPSGEKDKKVWDYGTIFLVNPSKNGDSDASGINIAELLVARGYATVIKHRDFEERSNYYDALLSAESRAISGKKGMHSAKDPPARHMKDLLEASSAKKAKDFLPFLQRERRLPAVVQFLFSGHRFKIDIQKETCSIAFSLAGVRCPIRDEPYAKEAMLFMRRKIMQRDVEIEVESVDKNGTFLGTLWESNTNVAIPLLETGLAKLQKSFAIDKIPNGGLLVQAEQSAKQNKLKIWEKYVEGEKVSNGLVVKKRQKEEFKVVITEVLGGGKFYVQTVADQKLASIEKQISSLSLEEPPVIDAFKPKRGDIVLAKFDADHSWNRAMIVNAPRSALESENDKFEVFYIDHGNQETVPYNQLRPLDCAISSVPGLAYLCGLAYLKVPSMGDDYGQEAAMHLCEHLLSDSKEFKAVIEERDMSNGKVKGQGTGTMFMVTMIDTISDININAMMLQEGLARLEKRRRRESKDKQQILDELEEFQKEAREKRLGMWEYGDIASDDEGVAPPLRLHANGEKKRFSQSQPALLECQVNWPSLCNITSKTRSIPIVKTDAPIVDAPIITSNSETPSQ